MTEDNDDNVLLYTERGEYEARVRRNVTRVRIDSSVTNFQQRVFQRCLNLVSVELPKEGLREIGAGAFEGCRSLRTIEIPSSILVIQENVFISCSNLVSV